MINLSELFVDRRKPWQKIRDKLVFWLVVLALVTVFGAGIVHLVGKFWH